MRSRKDSIIGCALIAAYIARKNTNSTTSAMPKKIEPSSDPHVPMYVIGFIDSYCRRNLSMDEIANIAEIFSAVEANDKQKLRSLLAKATQVVTTAPQRSFIESKGP